MVYRMKNGDLELTSTDSTFVIESASVNDTAYYNCRASNDFSAIYSSTASILVKGMHFGISCHLYCICFRQIDMSI